MKKYIGTKEVKARPMTAEEALKKGYRVGDNKGDGYEVEYADGYKSWSPKKAFEDAYRVADTWLDRVKIERDELASRLLKAKEAFGGNLRGIDNVAAKCGVHQCALILTQIHTMENYYEVLEARIQLAETDESKIG